MTAPLYVVVLPVSITLCIVADRTPYFRPIYLCAVLCFGGLFSALIAGILNFKARYVFLCFVNISMWSANPLALSFASTTFGPKEVCLEIDRSPSPSMAEILPRSPRWTPLSTA